MKGTVSRGYSVIAAGEWFTAGLYLSEWFNYREVAQRVSKNVLQRELSLYNDSMLKLYNLSEVGAVTSADGSLIERVVNNDFTAAAHVGYLDFYGTISEYVSGIKTDRVTIRKFLRDVEILIYANVRMQLRDLSRDKVSEVEITDLCSSLCVSKNKSE